MMGRSVSHFSGFDAFIDALRDAHAEILTARPDRRPGQFKKVGNVAGDTTFVEPDLARGTLRQGFEIARSLEEPRPDVKLHMPQIAHGGVEVWH